MSNIDRMEEVVFTQEFKQAIKAAVNGQDWLDVLNDNCESGIFECYEITTSTGMIRAVICKKENALYVHAFAGSGYTEAGEILRTKASEWGYTRIIARVSKAGTAKLLSRVTGAEMVYSEYEIDTGLKK